MNTIRICRPNGTHRLDHYWSTETGKSVKAPKGHTFTQEEICGKHKTRKKIAKWRAMLDVRDDDGALLVH